MFAIRQRILAGEDASLVLHKESSLGYSLYCNIVFLTTEFLDFQKAIIEEGVAQIYDMMEGDELFEDIGKNTEYIWQEANAKLVAFAEKMTTIESFDIRGVVMLTHHTNFIGTLIGDVSIVLSRRGRIVYTMQNDTDTRQKISLFSDIIEGDISREDAMYIFGTHVKEIVDTDEMNDIALKTEAASQEEAVDYWTNVLLSKVGGEEIGLVVQYSFAGKGKEKISMDSFHPLRSIPFFQRFPHIVENHTVRAIKDRVETLRQKTFARLGEKLQNKNFILLAIIIGVFLLFVLRSIVQAWIKNTAVHTIRSDGSITASLTVDDIKREIAEFQKLDPTSEEKGTKYNTLVAELDRIKSEGRRLNDVEQLKKILDMEYLQGFNILMFDSLQDQVVYAFSSLEQSTIGAPLQVFFSKGIYVAGKQGAILAGISSDIRGNSVSSIVNDDFKACSFNLLKNGLYCVTDKDTLFHIAKGGAEVLGGENIVFPTAIQGLTTFGSSSFYLFSTDPAYTKDRSYLFKYTNELGSQNTFGSTLVLAFNQDVGGDVLEQGFSSLSIDGTFLMWSKSKKALYQFYRDPQDKVLQSREVSLKGGLTVGKGLSDDIKVMTTATTRYVYLYDRKNHTVSVYISAPAKNSADYSTAYSLEYVMRLDFSNISPKVVDVAVDESDGKQVAYVLTDNGVAKVAMSDLLEALKKTRTVQ